ncbi:gliding motility-associated C-terminal domain-containing protein [Paracrocinitomix mangrovi]|uniref:gliding motility-associated C-terminal domain-containing protein n=1 Tax=Paracrocinitomix mangrovi TaxID=2862509 RepID=UPI001C8E6E05|nr:gliding motility-associated C-terminal domain-containing protein [Paracrocinitomix mangrovi]UKN03088.1 gliding motility-associated C-terminal domain-containing protein [Paracrocinitomix mangrovi]
MNLKLASLCCVLLFGLNQTFAQDTVWFNYTGAVQTYDIPPCASQVYVEMAGGSGGAQGPQFNQGDGAVITGVLTVPPGSTIEIWVGGAGGCGNGSGGFNGGGNGVNNSYTYDACGGGGASDIRVGPYTMGDRIAVAAGGGGEGGGGGGMEPSGGDGGCATGSQSTMFSWGDPGFGGTQTAGGAGGAAWGSGNGGQAGSLGQGGNGAVDPCYNIGPGGGGGGGYYGGGGGGSDCWAGGHLGGGGGGGGSSLVPLGGGCNAGANNGDGYVMLVIDGCTEPTICAGDTTVIDMTDAIPANVTGYSWSPAAGVANPNGGPIMDVFPSDSVVYTVTVTTTTGSFDLTYPVHVVQPVTPDAGLDDSLCHSTTSGVALNATLYNDGAMYWTMGSASTFSGGNGTAIFQPSTSPSTTALVNLPGYYGFVIHEEDTNGVCPEGTDTVMVYYSTESHTTTFTDPICFGASDGTITVTSDNTAASGNLGASIFTVDNGSGPITQNNGNFTGLPSGTYDVYTEDYLGCSFSSQVTLTDPPPIVMSLVSSDTTICINGTATLVASASGAPAGSGYMYYWTASTANTNSVSITPNPPGVNFSSDVYAISDEGCYSDTLTLNVDHYEAILAQITENDSVCPGYDSQHNAFNIIGGYLNGLPDYTYSWTANGSPMANISDNIDENPTTNTEYCVTINDGCETDPITLCTWTIMREVPQPIFTTDETEGCNPSTFMFWDLTDVAQPGITDSIHWFINGVHYNWDNTMVDDTLSIEFNQVGTYDVYMEVYSQYGCHNDTTIYEYITIHDVPVPLFYINPNPTNMFNTGVDMNNVTAGANNTYQWYFPGSVTPGTSTVENPSALYPEGVVAEYPVHLVVTNEWGCVDSTTALLDVVSDVLLYAPNIFTPDGDDYNESWRVYIDGIDIYDFHLTMFNRWGEPVWESYNQIASWNGSYGGGALVPDGTYVWVIECREINTDKKYEFRGHVTVLK